MSIQTSIERIESARNAIRAAITNKGVDASDATLDELAALISAIPLPVIDALRITANGTYTAPDGVDGYNPITVELPSAEQATPTISVSSSGLITASATQSGGLVAAGTKSATKQLTTKAAATITPTSSTQTAVSAGTYVTGDIKVAGVSSAKVKTGSFTVATSNVRTQNITHSLGVVPNFVVYLATSVIQGYLVGGIYLNGYSATFIKMSEAITLAQLSITGSTNNDTRARVAYNANTSTIIFGGANEVFGKTTYHWAVGSI